ncbi:MAG: hypothetical protein KH202_06415 [Clostridiales bacterium]|nr:hypothetical protein [Clostridiales bacterium]
MKNRWEEAFHGSYANYCMPFLWMHGNDENRIRLLMQEIHRSGIKAVCLESRPHPDFLGDTWWRDTGAALDEARRLGMKVWILDDRAFPSGYANGKLTDDMLAQKRWSLVQDCIDAAGPQNGVRFAIGRLLEEKRPPAAARETACTKKLFAVIACRTDGSAKSRLTGEFRDLTELVEENGMLYWDVPQGTWRVVVITAMTNACAACNNYVNFISKSSVRFLLDTVYEPHFSHFREEFGKTLSGFFSDEPGFYTGTTEMYPLNEQIGKRDLPLPWSEDLKVLMRQRYPELYKQMPLLWYDGNGSPRIRSQYMEAVTFLYQTNYVQQIGDWCEEHGVEYIGHVLEDDNSHARLGCGAGHYFRAMRGQHMAGVDVVFNQILPGRDFEEFCHRPQDGEFYHYALAKLASSAAHMESRMKGRALAEVFGAGGWAEDISWMKWLSDSLLVRGINHFVPHAYTTQDFPDPDCPPHFFAMGQNPQSAGMEKLYAHMNRCAHLLSGGKAVIHTAILYHASAEWCGESMLIQTPARVCMQNQADFDFLSEDLLCEAKVENGEILIRGNCYRLLLVPGCDYLPEAVWESLHWLHMEGASIIFLEKAPRPAREEEASWDNAPVHTITELPSLLRRHQCLTIRTHQAEPRLRCLHYLHQDRELFFLFNEEPCRSIDTTVVLPVSSPLSGYDPMENRIINLSQSLCGMERSVEIKLAPYESLFLLTGIPPQIPENNRTLQKIYSPLYPWSVTAKGTGCTLSLTNLQDLSVPNLLPRYSGVLEYRNVWDMPSGIYAAEVDLGELFGLAEIFVNGVSAGKRICQPYRFRVDGLLHPGKNEICVEISTTLFNRLQDSFSLHLPLPPTGLLGPTTLCVYS